MIKTSIANRINLKQALKALNLPFIALEDQNQTSNSKEQTENDGLKVTMVELNVRKEIELDSKTDAIEDEDGYTSPKSRLKEELETKNDF